MIPALRRTGYRRDPARRFVGELGDLRAASNLPRSVSLAEFAPPVFDQGPTGSCVGHARVRALMIARAHAGKPLEFLPSMADVYRLARCYSRENWADPLTDDGSDPLVTLDVMRSWGVRAAGPMARDGRFSDCELETINEPPTLANLESSALFRFFRDYQIRGSNKAEQIRRALANGHPVSLDVSGGSASWQEYAGGVIHVSQNEPLDHYVTLEGYDGEHFMGANSWGEDWGGFAGHFVVDTSVIEHAQDVLVAVEDEK